MHQQDTLRIFRQPPLCQLRFVYLLSDRMCPSSMIEVPDRSLLKKSAVTDPSASAAPSVLLNASASLSVNPSVDTTLKSYVLLFSHIFVTCFQHRCLSVLDSGKKTHSKCNYCHDRQISAETSPYRPSEILWCHAFPGHMDISVSTILYLPNPASARHRYAPIRDSAVRLSSQLGPALL